MNPRTPSASGTYVAIFLQIKKKYLSRVTVAIIVVQKVLETDVKATDFVPGN
jgi:hypothetical protein